MKVDKKQLMLDHKEMNYFRLLLNEETYSNPQKVIQIELNGDEYKPVVIKSTILGLIGLIRMSFHVLEGHTEKRSA